MKDTTLRLRESIKEDLVVLGFQNYQCILGFRRIFGKGKETLSVAEIVDGLKANDLSYLRDLTKRTSEKYKNTVAEQV
jgi:hypothetical protein